MHVRTSCLTILTVLIFMTATAAQDQSAAALPDATAGPWHRLEVRIGAFLSDFSTNVRLGGQQLGFGLDIDVESVLGLSSSGVILRADALYRFGQTKRHGAGISILRINRNAARELRTDIDIEDRTFTAGTVVNSEFNLMIVQGLYDYSIFRDSRFDVGSFFGFFVMPIKVGIKTTAQDAKKTDFVAPLPVVGVRSDFAITPNLFLRQGIALLYIKVGAFESRLLDVRIALEYEAWEHFGFGLGVNAFRLAVKAEGEDYPGIDFVGDIGLGYTGMLGYFKYSL